MLEILRSTNTIEDAVFLISRKLELMHKIFSKIRSSGLERGTFALSLLRNLDPENIVNKSLKSIDTLI
jgi:hypothetical protein